MFVFFSLSFFPNKTLFKLILKFIFRWITGHYDSHDATAVFETVPEQSFPSQTIAKTLLQFDFEQKYVYGTYSLVIGRFRLSYTTESRDYFADGLGVDGNVNASLSWKVLHPFLINSTSSNTYFDVLCGNFSFENYYILIIFDFN